VEGTGNFDITSYLPYIGTNELMQRLTGSTTLIKHPKSICISGRVGQEELVPAPSHGTPSGVFF
jgi:hypothetical protein